MKFYIVWIVYLLSESFFGLIELPTDSVNIMLFLTFSFILIYSSKMDFKAFKDDFIFYIYFLWAIVLSIIMSDINFHQPVSFSILASKSYILYILLLVLFNILLKQIKYKQLDIFIITVSFIIFITNFYVYITGDTSIFHNIAVLERLGEVRVVIGSSSIVFLIFYLYYGSSANKKNMYMLLALLFVLIVVHKTRSVIFPVLFIMFIPYINIIKFKSLKVVIILFLIYSFSLILSGFEKSIFDPLVSLVDLALHEANSNKVTNINIRGIEFEYFMNKLDLNSIIFGYGMENKSFVGENIYGNFYLSDLGLFKVFYLHGIIGFVFFVMILWKFYIESKKGNSAIHKASKSIVYFQILSPTITFANDTTGILLFLFFYIIMKRINNFKEINEFSSYNYSKL